MAATGRKDCGETAACGKGDGREDGTGGAMRLKPHAPRATDGQNPARPRSAGYETSLSFSIVPKKQSRAPLSVYEYERA